MQRALALLPLLRQLVLLLILEEGVLREGRERSIILVEVIVLSIRVVVYAPLTLLMPLLVGVHLPQHFAFIALLLTVRVFYKVTETGTSNRLVQNIRS